METFFHDEKLDFETQTDIHTLLENVRCRNGNDLNQEQAYLALSTLCSSQVEAQNYFHDAGGVEDIVQILTDGSCQLTLCPSALFCLACAVKDNVRSQNIVLRQDFFKVIHRILSNHEISRKLAMAASFFIACSVSGSGSGQFLVFDTHCLTDVLTIFRALIAEQCKDLNHWATVTQAISFCIGNPQNERNQNVSCGIIPSALKVIRECSHHKIIHHILSLIGLIVVNNVGNQNRFRTCGGLEILMDLICHLRQNQSPSDKLYHEVLITLISALDLCIADNEMSVKMTVEMGLVKHLFGILEEIPRDTVDLHIFLLALTHLFEFAGNPRRLMLGYNGRDILVKCMTESEDEEVFKAIKYIFILCNNEGEEDELMLSMRNLNERNTHAVHDKSDQRKKHCFGAEPPRFENLFTSYDNAETRNNVQITDIQNSTEDPLKHFKIPSADGLNKVTKMRSMNGNTTMTSRRVRQELELPMKHIFEKSESEQAGNRVMPECSLHKGIRDKTLSLVLHPPCKKTFFEPLLPHNHSKRREILTSSTAEMQHYPGVSEQRKYSRCGHRNCLALYSQNSTKPKDQSTLDHFLQASVHQDALGSTSFYRNCIEDVQSQGMENECNFKIPPLPINRPSTSSMNCLLSPTCHYQTNCERQHCDYTDINGDNFKAKIDSYNKDNYHQTSSHPSQHVNKSTSAHNKSDVLENEVTSFFSRFHNLISTFLENFPRVKKSGKIQEEEEVWAADNFRHTENPVDFREDFVNTKEASPLMTPFDCANPTDIYTDPRTVQLASLKLRDKNACCDFRPTKDIQTLPSLETKTRPQEEDDGGQTILSVSTVQYSKTHEQSPRKSNAQDYSENICGSVKCNSEIIKTLKSLIALNHKPEDTGILTSCCSKKRRKPDNCSSQTIGISDQETSKIDYNHKREDNNRVIAKADSTCLKSSPSKTHCNLKRAKAISTIQLSNHVSEYSYTPQRSNNSNIITNPNLCSLRDRSGSMSKSHSHSSESRLISLQKTPQKTGNSHGISTHCSCSKKGETSHSHSFYCSCYSKNDQLSSNSVSADDEISKDSKGDKTKKTPSRLTNNTNIKSDLKIYDRSETCLVRRDNKSTLQLNTQRAGETEQTEQSLHHAVGNTCAVSEVEDDLLSVENIGSPQNIGHLTSTPYKEKPLGVGREPRNPQKSTVYQRLNGQMHPATVGPTLGIRLQGQRSNDNAYNTPLKLQSVRKKIFGKDNSSQDLPKDDAWRVDRDEKQMDAGDKFEIYRFKSTDESKKELSTPESVTSVSIREPKHRDRFRRSRLPYTDQEILNLRHGVANMGTRWQQILCTYQFQPDRTAVDLKEKFKRLMTGCNKNSYKKIKGSSLPFSKCEIKRLTRGVRMFGHNWKAILAGDKFLPGRSAEDLRTKWRTLIKK